MVTKLRVPIPIVTLAGIVGKDTAEFKIGNVHVSSAAGQCRAEATDGRRLLQIRWADPEAPAMDVLIPPGMLRWVSTYLKENELDTAQMFVKTEGNHVYIELLASNGNKSLAQWRRARNPEDRFPSLAEILDRTGFEDTQPISLNPELLRGLAEAIGGTCERATFRVSKRGIPVMRFDGEHDGLSVSAMLMPMANETKVGPSGIAQ